MQKAILVLCSVILGWTIIDTFDTAEHFKELRDSNTKLQTSINALQKPTPEATTIPEAQKANPADLPEVAPSSLETACLKEETTHMDAMSALQKCKQHCPQDSSDPIQTMPCFNENTEKFRTYREEMLCRTRTSSLDTNYLCHNEINLAHTANKKFVDCLALNYLGFHPLPEAPSTQP